MFSNVFADPKTAAQSDIDTANHQSDVVAARSSRGFLKLQAHVAPLAQMLQNKNISIAPSIPHTSSYLAGLSSGDDDGSATVSFHTTGTSVSGSREVALICGEDAAGGAMTVVVGVYGSAIEASGLGADQRLIFSQLGLICGRRASCECFFSAWGILECLVPGGQMLTY
jgi:hypothetical protein